MRPLPSGGLGVAGGVHPSGPVHRTAERQLQLPVDHQSTQQGQPDRHVTFEG